jgi:hypothetical protein
MVGAGRPTQTVHALLGNCVRWLVSRRDVAGAGVRPLRRAFESGDEVRFVAQAYDTRLVPVGDAEVRVWVFPEGDGEEQSLLLAPVPGARGRYEASLGSLPEGEYRYEATVVTGESVAERSQGTFSVEPFTAEHSDPRLNEDLLVELARRTGGDYRRIGRLAGEPLRVEANPVRSLYTRRLDLRSSLSLFFAVVALLGVEWGIRKRNALP